jgi:hypothetical protein
MLELGIKNLKILIITKKKNLKKNKNEKQTTQNNKKDKIYNKN